MRKAGIFGGVMALMMLAMLHKPIMEGSFSSASALIAFVAAHLAIVAGVGLVALLVPRVRHLIAGHRPSGSHMAAMGAGAVLVTALVHGSVHGLSL